MDFDLFISSLLDDKESYDLLTKVTEEDLLEFLSRLKLDTIYFLKEMQDEQNRKNNIN